jgi:hypothetical protein
MGNRLDIAMYPTLLDAQVLSETPHVKYGIVALALTVIG